MSETELLDDCLPDATMTQEEMQQELQVIGRRASRLQIENEAWKQEVDELAAANDQQIQDLETQASEIQKFKAEKKKQENHMENLEQHLREAEKQRWDDVEIRERLVSEVKSSKERARELQKEIDVQLSVALGVGERLKKAEELNDWYKQRTGSPQLGEWLRGVANEQQRTDMKIAELKNALSSLIQIEKPLPDVMDQEEEEEVDFNFNNRPRSRICEFEPMRTLEDEMNDAQSYGHIMPDIQPTQLNHDVHPLNRSLEMDIDCGPNDDSASEYSLGYSFQSMVDSHPDAMESDSSIDSSGYLCMSGEMSYSDEDTASNSDEVENHEVQSFTSIMAESVSECGSRKMSFVIHDGSEDSRVTPDTQDMDWEATGWESSTSSINHSHLKRAIVDIVDDNGCFSGNKKQRNGSQMMSPITPSNTEKPLLEQITQTTKTTEIAPMGVQTDKSSTAAAHDIQAVEKSENPRPFFSPTTNTSTGVQTAHQGLAKIEQESQDRALTEIPGHEVQVVAPREHISLESIPHSQNGTILLAPLSGTAARVKRRFIDGFKLLTNTDQGEVLPSHQNQIRATTPNPESDTVQDYPEAESMAIMITDDVYLEHIMQWVEHILKWVSRWTPFLKILMVFLAWLLYMWWTDDQWQWKKANEIPRNVFREVRQGVYELGKYQSVDRVALG